ncbi:MAG: FAD-dependent oxidoreductase [Bacteroidales bacterium]|nr:FAD-dependent oxidoreductase [Bacteroidales bacterium]
MNKDFDVAIIGAGSAGTSCALALRNSGLKVALIDKSRFPRNKTCGDAVPGATLKYLKEISTESYDEFRKFKHKQKVESGIVYLANGKSLEFN